MGFCLFNNVAVAAAHARDRHGLERIAIVDFDVHHGNGTQSIFQSEPKVAYLSSHQSGIYPHTGGVRDRGAGNLHNALLPPGSGSFRFRNTWLDTLLPALDDFRPQLLLLSAGFDGHMADPLADLMLDADDFAWITGELRTIARRHGGRIVSMLEGATTRTRWPNARSPTGCAARLSPASCHGRTEPRPVPPRAFIARMHPHPASYQRFSARMPPPVRSPCACSRCR